MHILRWIESCEEFHTQKWISVIKIFENITITIFPSLDIIHSIIRLLNNQRILNKIYKKKKKLIIISIHIHHIFMLNLTLNIFFQKKKKTNHKSQQIKTSHTIKYKLRNHK